MNSCFILGLGTNKSLKMAFGVGFFRWLINYQSIINDSNMKIALTMILSVGHYRGLTSNRTITNTKPLALNSDVLKVH